MKILICLTWMALLASGNHHHNYIEPCMAKHCSPLDAEGLDKTEELNYNHNDNVDEYIKTQHAKNTSKLSMIVDTDIGGFGDDPAALAVLHGLADQGKVDILAMVGSTQYEGIVMAMDVLNTFFGRPHIPLGVTKDPKAYSDPQGSQNWTEYIRDRFAHRLHKNAEAEDSITVLRRTLAAAPNHSVIILQIGHFTNLANLLNTSPDNISPLTGRMLAGQKVSEVITMAGQFPSGLEWNIEKDIASARRFASDWPTPISFVGFEIGHVPCGTKYQHREQELMQHNPLAAASYFGYERYGNYGGCFDAVAALVATRQTSNLYCGVGGKIQILQNGTDTWANSPQHHLQQYLKVKSSNVTTVNTVVSTRINDYLPMVNNTTKAL